MSVASGPVLAGTFNDWQLDGLRAKAISSHEFEVRCTLTRGRHAFKWIWNGTWEGAWGARAPAVLVPPLEGHAAPGGGDVVVNVLVGGPHVITLDTRSRRYRVVRPDPIPDLGGVLSPHALLEGSFGGVVRRLREGAEGEPFGYAWRDWGRLAPFLDEGAFRGFFPVREGGRALFVFNAHLSGPLFMAHDFNGWQVGPDQFTRVEGTDLHYLYREFPHDALLRYKLVTEGAWFADPFNRWVEPDGLPVPMFQTGTFNSVVDFGAPGHVRGHHLIHLRFPSVVREHTRDVWISLPRHYSPHHTGGYPVLYVNDGNEALTRVFLHGVARSLMDRGEAAPAILVFVGLADPMERNYEYTDPIGREAYGAFLARELVPFIDASFRTRTEPQGRGIVGASYGGISAWFMGWRYPDLFGCVAGQGTSFFAHDWDVLNRFVESPRRRLRLYMDSAMSSYKGGPRDSHASARYAYRVLREAGYRVKHVVRTDQGHDWPSWAERFPEILREFWPA